jgi:hypothetical protein
MPKPTPKTVPKPIFIASEWCLSERRWSDKWKDANGVLGSFFYIALNGLSEYTDLPDGNQGVVIKKSLDGIEPDTIMLRIAGGKKMADTLPEKVYMNIHSTTHKFSLLPVSDFEQRTSAPSIGSLEDIDDSLHADA